MTPASVTILAVVLGCLLTASLSLLGFMARAYIKQGARLSEIAADLRVLKTGATEGAQALFRQLQSDVQEIVDWRDEFQERYQETRTSVAILADRTNGHIRTPQTHAHPPAILAE